MIEARLAQEIAGAVVDVERRQQVGVAVRHEGEAAGEAVEHAVAAIGAALHPDLVPQIAGAQIAARDDVAAVRLDAGAIEVGALADIVDLRRDHEAFGARGVGDVPRRALRRTVRHGGEEFAELRLDAMPVRGIGGDVAQHDGSIEKGRADAFERGMDAVPVAVDVVDELAQEEQIADAAHLLVGPVGLEEVGAQPSVDIARAAGDEPRFDRRLLLEQRAAGSVRGCRAARAVRMSRMIDNSSPRLFRQRLAAQVEPGCAVWRGRAPPKSSAGAGCRRSSGRCAATGGRNPRCRRRSRAAHGRTATRREGGPPAACAGRSRRRDR